MKKKKNEAILLSYKLLIDTKGKIHTDPNRYGDDVYDKFNEYYKYYYDKYNK